MYDKIIDFRFGFETLNLISKMACFSVTSTIDRSSSSTVTGKTCRGESDPEKIPSSETSLIIDCPEKAMIPITTANPATTTPTKIFGCFAK